MAPISPRVAISTVFAIDGAVLGGWFAHLPDAQTQYGLSKGELGSTLLFSSIGALAAMGFSGRLIGRFGSRRICLITTLLVLMVIPMLLRASDANALALTLVVLGAVNGTLDIAMNDHAVAIQAGAPRPILSSVHGWWCIGGFGGALGAALASRLDILPKDHLLVASCTLLILLPVAMRGLLRDTIRNEEDEARFAFPKGRLLRLGLLCLVALFAEGALLDWSAVYFRDELRTSATVAALGFGVGSAAMAVGRLSGDGVTVRLGREGTIRLSGILTGGGLLFAVATVSPIGAFIGFGIAGLGLANAVPVFFATAAEVPGVSSGAGIAAVASMGYAAFLGGPPIVGNIAQVTSLRFGVGLVGAFAFLIAVYGPRSVAERA